MNNRREGREELHRAIAEAVNNDGLAPGASGGVLTRWCLLAEVAMPDRGLALVTLTNQAGGADLAPWDAGGFWLWALATQMGAKPPFAPQEET